LSGVSDDGAIGIQRIKEAGGITVAQNPEESQHDGMPRSAIETGMVDWVLPVAEMPRRLLENLRKSSS
jgi:two-component system CheB/CheR fusion protein